MKKMRIFEKLTSRPNVMQRHIYGYIRLNSQGKGFHAKPGTIQSSSLNYGDKWQGESEEASKHKSVQGCTTPSKLEKNNGIFPRWQSLMIPG